MKSIPELAAFYKDELLPDLKKLERIRKAQVVRQVYILATLTFSILLATVMSLPTMVLVFMSVFLIVYFIIFGFKRKRFDFKKSYKDVVLKKLYAFVFPDAEYTPFQFIPQKYYEQCELFLPGPDIYNGEDLIKGNAGGMPFQLSEIETLKRNVDPDGKVFFTPLFKGIFYIAELGEKTAGSTYLFGNNTTAFLDAFHSWYSDINMLAPERLNTGDSGFDALFALYATDTDTAFQRITPAVKKLMADYKEKRKAGVQLAVIDRFLYLAIPASKDLFEASMYKTLLKFDTIEQHYATLRFCMDMADAFQSRSLQ